jgi:hypothetical protein
MKIYLWLHDRGRRSVHEANPHVKFIHNFLFVGNHITEGEFNFLVENANLVDTNGMGWKVWELEL